MNSPSVMRFNNNIFHEVYILRMRPLASSSGMKCLTTVSNVGRLEVGPLASASIMKCDNIIL